MHQIIQSLRTGKIEIADVPKPQASRNSVLIQTTNTLISPGTEKMLLEFGKMSFVGKARQQPDKVRMTLNKIKTDGLLPTVDTISRKLDQPLSLGYSNVGRVIELGLATSGINIGDRVISNGKHAEVVSVPTNLCAKVPDTVSDEEAVFTVLGSIALQSIRLVQPTLGETVVVTGLGLVGLLTIQLLRAHGCRVLGIDFDTKRLELAQQFGAEVVNLAAGQDPLKLAELYSRGRGVDAVIVAAATKSSDPINQAAIMCRKRGRIVLVGVTGLEFSRENFFKKELTFQVSSSYGPGRYDTNYEDKGHDYPFGYVRWTEQRNFEAVLDMMEDGRLDVKPLISHRFDIIEAKKAYELVSNGEKSIGILLRYPNANLTEFPRVVKVSSDSKHKTSLTFRNQSEAIVSFLGAGNYAMSMLIPAFKATGVHLLNIASSTGVSGLHAARKFGFETATTDTDGLFTDNKTNAIVITTQHDSHSRFVIKALEHGKHIFVEKPLCLNLSELNKIQKIYEKTVASMTVPPVLMVGFNRRFAPHVQKMKQLLYEISGPKSFVMTINAGEILADHWTQDPEKGGGRIIGEVCHFIDLLRFLAASPIKHWSRSTMETITNDTFTISLKFVDGSIGTIHYFANGTKAYPKESLEVFATGRVLKLDNYRTLYGFGWPNFKKMRLWRQDKGQKACVLAFVNSITGKALTPIPIDELLEVSRITIEIAQ